MPESQMVSGYSSGPTTNLLPHLLQNSVFLLSKMGHSQSPSHSMLVKDKRARL